MFLSPLSLSSFSIFSVSLSYHASPQCVHKQFYWKWRTQNLPATSIFHNSKIREKNLKFNAGKSSMGDLVFITFLRLIFGTKNQKIDIDFEPNFSEFFVWLLNKRLSLGWEYFKCKEDFPSIFKKIPHEHIADLDC